MKFETAIERVLKIEGRYNNNMHDPGGETNYGISKRSYPNLDIKNLTREQAIEIYRRDFWENIHAEQLYDGVAYQSLDFAINSGIGVAIRALQRALGVVDDGLWGPVSGAAAKTLSEAKQIMRLNAERLDFMRKLPNWSYASKGWAARIAQNLRYGAEDI